MLKNVIQGKLKTPIRCLLYGTEKIGKSTFAANAPAPIFLCSESGTSQLDIARFPEPETWSEALTCVDELISHPHDYKTLVIDTVDWLAPLLHTEIIRTASSDRNGIRPQRIDDVGGGFGKGFAAAVCEWRILLNKLDTLRAKRGMAIILVGHAWIKQFANPEGASYDRYELKLSRAESGLLKEWADCVLFANYITATITEGLKSKGVGNSARLIHTQRCAAFDAGNRFSLPETMPLDWDTFASAIDIPVNLDAIRTEIMDLVANDSSLTERATTAIQAYGDDASKLSQLRNKLRSKHV